MKVCVSRQTIPSIDYAFSEKWRPNRMHHLYDIRIWV